jgi:hypothetical protein
MANPTEKPMFMTVSDPEDVMISEECGFLYRAFSEEDTGAQIIEIDSPLVVTAQARFPVQKELKTNVTPIVIGSDQTKAFSRFAIESLGGKGDLLCHRMLGNKADLLYGLIYTGGDINKKILVNGLRVHPTYLIDTRIEKAADNSQIKVRGIAMAKIHGGGAFYIVEKTFELVSDYRFGQKLKTSNLVVPSSEIAKRKSETGKRWRPNGGGVFHTTGKGTMEP